MPNAYASLTLMAALLLAGCQASGPGSATKASVERDPRASGIVVVRSYEDEFKTDGGDLRVNVEYAWDYDRAIAVERITDAHGKLISLTDQPELTLNLTDAEQAYAFDLTRAHPDLKSQVAGSDHLYGGFSYRDANDPACYRGSRCVHVMASSSAPAGDGWRKVLHAIVDLQSGRVVHPHYDDAKTEPLDTSELRAKGN
jgi:hypothetical protein